MRYLAAVFVFTTLVSIFGCGGSYPEVSGLVTVGDEPLRDGTIKFYRDGSSTVGPTGTIAGGTYGLATNGVPGAPAGKYKVTIGPGLVVNPDVKSPAFNEKYKDVATTPLTIDVVANPAPGAYDIKLEQ